MANERKFVTENIRRVLLKEYLMKAVDRAGFGGVEVQRTPMGTRVTLITERPGIVIGRRGAAIKTLTTTIEKDFKFDNPQVEVQDIEVAQQRQVLAAHQLGVQVAALRAERRDDAPVVGQHKLAPHRRAEQAGIVIHDAHRFALARAAGLV